MSLSVSFRVVGMRADESMEHTITIMEQRRPLLREAQQAQQLGGPVNPGRGLAQGLELAQGMAQLGGQQLAPQAVINVPVTPEQFATFRINQTLELGIGADMVGALIGGQAKTQR